MQLQSCFETANDHELPFLENYSHITTSVRIFENSPIMYHFGNIFQQFWSYTWGIQLQIGVWVAGPLTSHIFSNLYPQDDRSSFGNMLISSKTFSLRKIAPHLASKLQLTFRSNIFFESSRPKYPVNFQNYRHF